MHVSAMTPRFIIDLPLFRLFQLPPMVGQADPAAGCLQLITLRPPDKVLDGDGYALSFRLRRNELKKVIQRLFGQIQCRSHLGLREQMQDPCRMLIHNAFCCRPSDLPWRADVFLQ